MSVLIKDMEMPKECHGCRWFYFQGTSCTEPKYYLDARCKMVESGQDWYGKDAHGGWIGESIEHIPGWTGYYPYKHCVEMGTRASQCPLCELPSAQPEQRPLTEDDYAYCAECDHVEMCGWYPMYGCELKSRPSAQPEPCDDAVSRRRLLSDLKELIAAWEKYPVMAEQIKGVETAIGYVETIPSVTPKQQWISVSERLPEEKDVGRALKELGIKKRSDYVIATVEVKGKRITATACTYDGAWDWDMKYAYPDYKVIAWMPLPEPYTERREE